MLVRWAVRRVLDKTKSVEKRADIICTLIRDSKCVGLTSQWLDDITDPKKDIPFPKVEGEALTRLNEAWLERVRAAAHDGSLLGVCELRWVLQDWTKRGSPSEARDWVSSLTQDTKGIIIFLKALINRASAQALGSYYRKDTSWLSWKTLAEFQQQYHVGTLRQWTHRNSTWDTGPFQLEDAQGGIS